MISESAFGGIIYGTESGPKNFNAQTILFSAFFLFYVILIVLNGEVPQAIWVLKTLIVIRIVFIKNAIF